MGVTVREKVKGSGVWWVFVAHKGQRASLQVGSEKAADKTREILEAQLKTGQFVFPSNDPAKPRPTVEKYFQTFRANYLETAVAASTLDVYDRCFKHHILPELGALRLDEVTAAKMERFVAQLVGEKKLARETIATILRKLVRLYSHARKHKLTTENPASGLADLYRQAPIRHEKIEALTPEEVPLLLAAAREAMPWELRKVKDTREGAASVVSVPGSRNWALKRYTLFLAAIHTGLRAGELAGLEWGDVDWNSKFVSVERGYDRERRKVVPTKSKKIRRVDLSDELADALQALRKHELEAWFARKDEDRARLESAGLWDETFKLPRAIFANEDGDRPDMGNVAERHFHRCLKAAGLKRRRFHDLRHTFASLLLTRGAPIAYVSEQLGHSSIELTVKRYGHLIPGANRRFVNAMPGARGDTTAAEAGVG